MARYTQPVTFDAPKNIRFYLSLILLNAAFFEVLMRA